MFLHLIKSVKITFFTNKINGLPVIKIAIKLNIFDKMLKSF